MRGICVGPCYFGGVKMTGRMQLWRPSATAAQAGQSGAGCAFVTSPRLSSQFVHRVAPGPARAYTRRMEQGELSNTERVVALVSGLATADDRMWAEFDAAFLDAAFTSDPSQPYFPGPHGLACYGFVVDPESLFLVSPRTVLKDIAYWVAGAAVVSGARELLFAYSPGEVLSLALWGRSRVRWGGRWSEPPDTEEYRRGGQITAGRPNADLLPPLAARALEFCLRPIFAGRPGLAGRVPSVCGLRPTSRSGPEDPTDLAINITASDLGGDGAAAVDFLRTVGWFLPLPIATRLITMPESLIAGSAVTPLKDIVMAGGLDLAPP